MNKNIRLLDYKNKPKEAEEKLEYLIKEKGMTRIEIREILEW